MTPEDVSRLFGVLGLVFFVGLFLSVVIYALWPGNGSRFQKASEQPLNDDDLIDTSSRS
ncbi:MAG: cbb3-type cytochrome c oxidase subunit 3 [Pseudomonadota bacterium]